MTLSSLSAQDPGAQLNLHHALGPPNVIMPEPGDLVLLCAQRVSVWVSFFDVDMLFSLQENDDGVLLNSLMPLPLLRGCPAPLRSGLR